jgi:hypothetical protein
LGVGHEKQYLCVLFGLFEFVYDDYPHFHHLIKEVGVFNTDLQGREGGIEYFIDGGTKCFFGYVCDGKAG